MDSGRGMILPKGIFVNTNNIYKEVANYSIVPPDKVREYWHVYTTTYKKLKDPTARRLEHFWWHVWGSDRRFLKGSALAKLYEEISTGPTFVPLKGPPNRWEGPDIPPLLRKIMEVVEAEEAKSQQLPTEPQEPQPLTRSGELVALKVLSRSASKPPPSHPILKKPGRPSSSRPRQTTRFISPHESEDENDISSSGTTATTGSDQPLYIAVPPKKKTPPPPIKKFTAASAAAKRRPQIPRRLSSQLSVVSDAGSRGDSLSAGTRDGSVQRPVSPIAEHSSKRLITEDSTSSSVSEEPPVMSEKARGKQPAVPLRSALKMNGMPKKENRASIIQKQPTIRRQETATPPDKPALPPVIPPINLAGQHRRGSATTRSRFGVASLESGSSGHGVSPVLVRSKSQNGYEHPKEQATHRLPVVGFFKGATATTTNIAVQGTILDQTGLSSMPLPTMLDDQKTTFYPIQRTASFLDSRFTPTQPAPAASAPLARTKSQLTLLLEREKARDANKARSKS